MNRYFPGLIASFGAFVVLPTVVLAIGFTLPDHQLKQYGNSSIHGYEVNGEVVIFFQGDTTKLNEYLRKVSNERYGKRKATLHVGSRSARSPWDQEGAKEKRQADWNSEITLPKADGSDITVHIWIGRNVHLADLEIPETFIVDSGGEIDSFIRSRRQNAREQE